LNHYDIIYIDGSHDRPDVLEDAVLCWRLLKEGGIMIFDDYRYLGRRGSDNKVVSPKAAIDAFVQCFEEHCEVIHNGIQLIVRKGR
jgi:predicted O-methyltransferase YrrM